MSSEASTGPMASGAPKDDRRYDRLRMKNKLEVFLTKEYHTLAREDCADFLKTAVKCRDAAGLLTAFKCRDEHAAMNQCLGRWTKDEARKQAFMNKRIEEMKAAQDAAVAAANVDK